MKTYFTHQNEFRILLCDSNSSAIKKLKMDMTLSGFNDTIFEVSKDAITSAIADYKPHVIVANYPRNENENTFSFVRKLRRKIDLPIIILGDESAAAKEGKTVSLKKTYMLSRKDGINPLIDILLRIKMKAKNPAQWC